MVDVHTTLRRGILLAIGATPLTIAACDATPDRLEPGHASPGVRPPEPVAHEADDHEHGLGDHVHRYEPDRASRVCLEQYARDKGFGLGDEHDPDDLYARCMDAIGEEDHCQVESLISRDAARCIAEAKGLEPGVDPWKLTLVVDRGHQEIIWNVTSVTAKDQYGVHTKSVQIDADSGEHLIGGEDHKGGRPLFAPEGARMAGTRHREDWREPLPRLAGLDQLPPRVRDQLGQHWLEAARDEHASVAAFARATSDLLRLGAPAELVRAHVVATDDERRHARRFFALASQALGLPLGPGPLPLPPPTSRDAETIALDVLRGGCINETLAALHLQRAALGVASPVLRRLLLEVADDERRHAALAWRTLVWLARAHGLPPMRLGELVATPTPGSTLDLPAWGAVDGRLGARWRREAAEAVLRPALRAARARVPEITNALRGEL